MTEEAKSSSFSLSLSRPVKKLAGRVRQRVAAGTGGEGREGARGGRRWTTTAAQRWAQETTGRSAALAWPHSRPRGEICRPRAAPPPHRGAPPPARPPLWKFSVRGPSGKEMTDRADTQGERMPKSSIPRASTSLACCKQLFSRFRQASPDTTFGLLKPGLKP
jgi:hypothetical protein